MSPRATTTTWSPTLGTRSVGKNDNNPNNNLDHADRSRLLFALLLLLFYSNPSYIDTYIHMPSSIHQQSIIMKFILLISDYRLHPKAHESSHDHYEH